MRTGLLTTGKIYDVLIEKTSMYQVVDNEGNETWHMKSKFEVVKEANQMFKVGDIVKGKNNSPYYFTNIDMTKAKVLDVSSTGNNNIYIEILEHKKFPEKKGHTYWVNSKHFELVAPVETVKYKGEEYITENRAGEIVLVPVLDVESNKRFDDKFKADRVIWNRAKGTTTIHYTIGSGSKVHTMTAQVKPGDTFDKQKGFEVCCIKARIRIWQDKLSKY
jgi:exosome complex RNA-binding protein Csl4